MVVERRVTRSMTKQVINRREIISNKFRQFVMKSIIKKQLTNKNTNTNKEKYMAVVKKNIHYPDNSFLSENNKHTRDQNIRFQEKGHIYYVKGAAGYTSVTTFVHSFSKPFDQDAVIARIMKKEDRGQYNGMNAWQIKKLWKDNGRLACEMGTAMHLGIETYYNYLAKDGQEAVDNSDYRIGGRMWDGLDSEASQFRSFALGHYDKITPYRLEWSIYDEDLKITGSIDAIFKNNNGGYDMYDWKRCKEIKKGGFENYQHPVLCGIPDSNYWQYSLQLNLYKFILEKNYGIRIDNMYLVAIHPDFKTFQKHQAPNLNNEVVELFKYENMLK